MNKSSLTPKSLYVFFAIEIILAGVVMLLDVITGFGLISIGLLALFLIRTYDKRPESLPKLIRNQFDAWFNQENSSSVEEAKTSALPNNVKSKIDDKEVESRSYAINRIIVLTDNLRTEAYDESFSTHEISKIKELLGWAKPDNDFFFSVTAYSETVRHVREARTYIRENFPNSLINPPVSKTGLVLLLNRTSSNLIEAIKGNDIDLKWALEPQRQIGVNVLQFQNIDFKRIFKSGYHAPQQPQSTE